MPPPRGKGRFSKDRKPKRNLPYWKLANSVPEISGRGGAAGAGFLVVSDFGC